MLVTDLLSSSALPSYRRLSSPRFREAVSVDRVALPPTSALLALGGDQITVFLPSFLAFPSSFPSSPFPTPSPAFSAPSIWF